MCVALAAKIEFTLKFGFSSISSSLNSSAACTWEDLLEGRLKNLTELQKSLVNKLIGKH